MKHSAQPSTAGDCAGNDVSESITEVAMVHTHTSSSDSSVTSPTLECNRGTGAPIGNCVETAVQVRFEETGKRRDSGDERSKENVPAPGGALFHLNVHGHPPAEADVWYVSPREKSIRIGHRNVENPRPAA